MKSEIYESLFSKARIVLDYESSIGRYPSVIIICEDNKLTCLESLSENDVAIMERQSGYGETPLVFNANSFATKCMPDIISKYGLYDQITISFLDSDDSIVNYEVLLDEWIISLSKKRHKIQTRIDIQTFRIDMNGILHPKNSINYIPEKRQAKIHNKIRSHDENQLEKIFETDIEFDGFRKSILPGQAFNVSEIDDFPAEFHKIVWNLLPPSGHSYNKYRFWNDLLKTDIKSTFEIAEGLHKDLQMSQLFDLFVNLRNSNNKYIAVPMIGYNPKWLFTNSCLSQYSLSESIIFSIDDLLAFENIFRYRNSDTTSINRSDPQIIRSIKTCLTDSQSGINLMDLTEDVICDLTGNSIARLSLADVCRVSFALRVNL